MPKQNRPSKTLKKKSGLLSSKPRVIAIVVGFAAVGGLLVYRSFAAVLPPTWSSQVRGFQRMNIANAGLIGKKNASIVTDPIVKYAVYKVPTGGVVATNNAKEMPADGIFCFSVRADRPIAKGKNARYPINGVGIWAQGKEKVASPKPTGPLGEPSIGSFDVGLVQKYSAVTMPITTKWTTTCTKMVGKYLSQPGNIRITSGVIRNYSTEPIYVSQGYQDVPTY